MNGMAGTLPTSGMTVTGRLGGPGVLSIPGNALPAPPIAVPESVLGRIALLEEQTRNLFDMVGNLAVGLNEARDLLGIPRRDI